MIHSRLLLCAAALSSACALAACNGASATSSNSSTAAGTTPANGSAAAASAPDRRAAESAMREVTLPAGTQLPIVLDTSIGSDTSRVEEPVHAHLARAIAVNGVTALEAGSRVSGVVTDATRSAKVKGRAHLAVRFDTLTPQGPGNDNARYPIETAAVGRTAQSTKKKDALEIGGGAVGGALVGALVGGKKGAAIGTAAGGGAGTAVVLSTRGQETRLPAGSHLTLRLSKPLTIRVKG
jgi:hypothetical protein